MIALEADFTDVQDLIEDHELAAPSDVEEFAEQDIAEVLAAFWREKRQELNRLQKSRQFGKVKELKRSFRVEVEEMKAKTTCNRCGKRGHWARECPVPKGSGKGGKSNAGSSGSVSGAAVVESSNVLMHDFVAAVSPELGLLDKVRLHVNAKHSAPACADVPPIEVSLVSSPGYGVLDSGCGRTIVGAETLAEFEKLWKQRRGINPYGPTRGSPIQVWQWRVGNV